ncbi:MAG: hypothetical protein ACRDEA_20920 [Microcystaceae cyanobacterium]
MTSCSELDIWSSYRIASLSPLKKIALVVCEYWNSAEARWGLVDPQFDEVWREKLTIEHDILDLPRDRFVMASDAWVQCRVGEADPSKFGIFQGDTNLNRESGR